MISIGLDVSKGKSTICILKPYGEMIKKPFEVEHTENELEDLVRLLQSFDTEIRVVLEATGIYHLPILNYLQESKIFVAVINPYEMKKYSYRGLRRIKTDKHDSITIANFGIDNWFHLKNHESSSKIYSELKFLGRQYRHYMKLRIDSVLGLTHLLDHTMPGIKGVLTGWTEYNGKDKLSDFIEEFWHYELITKQTENQFRKSYSAWAKKKGYYQSHIKAIEIYKLAKKSIPILSSQVPSVKLLILEAVKVLRNITGTLMSILEQMNKLAKLLPEYPIVCSMSGVGRVLSLKLIAEIGDVRRFHSGKALVAYAGIDAPPYQSGQFIGTKRKISKRGSSNLRKIGYEVMRCLKTLKNPTDRKVYDFIIKKEKEGKAKRVAKIAGLNKFLRIYYARVLEIY